MDYFLGIYIIYVIYDQIKNFAFLLILNKWYPNSVEMALSKVDVTKRVGYIWQERWNEDGYDGLIPRFSGGRPSKLRENQKNELIDLLKKKDN